MPASSTGGDSSGLNARSPGAKVLHTLPLPADAGGELGQAAVYNAEGEYDADTDEWTVTDRLFDTEAALSLANQDIWVGQWGGEFYEGRGIPGTNHSPN